jgi:hypothetical protein
VRLPDPSPLAVVLGLMAASVAGGGFLVAAIVLGLWGWAAAGLSLGIGALAAILLGPAVEAAIKRADPAWDERRDRPRPLPVPLRSALRRDPDPARFDPPRHGRR